MKYLSALLLALWPALVWAENWPALFEVTGVASDDVLNIRAQPDGGSDIIGEFTHIQGNIEVVRTTDDGRWGLVNAGERSGWTAMRYLARQGGQISDGFPQPLFCGGTEPFWNTLFGTNGTLRFDLMGEPPLVLPQHAPAQAVGRTDKFAGIWADGQNRLTAVVSRAACNDGMSDREFGLAIDLLRSDTDGPALLFSGCCSLAPN